MSIYAAAENAAASSGPVNREALQALLTPRPSVLTEEQAAAIEAVQAAHDRARGLREPAAQLSLDVSLRGNT